MTETDSGYERSDADARTVAAAGAALVLMLVLVLAAMFGLYRFLAERPRPFDVPRPPLAGARAPQPAPRLEVSPTAALAELRAREAEALTTYGWMDREAGIVRIPIERAMEMIARDGLPVRP